MSETNDRKTVGGSARRMDRELKEIKDKKRVRTTAIIVVAVLALLFAGAMFLNSKYIRRTMTAVEIDGVRFTAAEYDYFFLSSYYEYQSTVYQTMPDYAESLLPSSEMSLSSQIYKAETGQTWADFISELALAKMSETVQFYNAAKAAGYTLPDDDRTRFDEEFAQMKEYAPMYGYSSFNAYLQAAYGPNIDEKTLLRSMEILTLSDSYANHIRESFEYTPELLEEFYESKKDMFDIYTYRYMLVMPETIDAADYETTDEYDAANEEALADAVKKAEEIADEVKSEQDFIDAAREYNAETYGEDDSTLRLYSGELLGDNYGVWLRDSSRKTGDVTTVEITTGCYVVYFIERSNNDYAMTSMRQILIPIGQVSESDYADDTAAYVDALNGAIKTAKETADTALAEFESGGATEEKLLELMETYSEDTTEGGLYENISMRTSNGGMVEEIDNWLFDPSREKGDYDLIFTDLYGYHLVYFMGYGERYRDYLAENGLRDNDYNAWKEGLGTTNVKTLWAFALKSQ